MYTDKTKEQLFLKIFNKGDFEFSYSSLNRLLFSPQLFYKEYILKEREIRMEKHLIEGSLTHLLLLEPQKFDDVYIISPSKTPSAALQTALKIVMNNKGPGKLADYDDDILSALATVNLYQSVKDDGKKLAKVITVENQTFYDFISTSDRTVIDQEAYDRCEVRVQLIKDNEDVMALFNDAVSTDFELDDVEVYNEQFLNCKTKDYKFGLKGYIDRYTVDHKKEEINIIDLKTTGKSIADFEDTVEFYNYWMQAAIYKRLVLNKMSSEAKHYKLTYRFVVIDKYNQVYVFRVTDKTMTKWESGLAVILDVADYHCINNRYDLPYKFLTQTVTI
tara:strand:- start:1291 stop:2289 length:999 start_codon:yes stop_codon:yes gene_type:complete